ncbi:MAG: hypothetical protein RLZZ61_1220 [Pseudomonadota bacterium]|jgi:hypothetical protein
MLHCVYLLVAIGATGNALTTARFGIDGGVLYPYMRYSTS